MELQFNVKTSHSDMMLKYNVATYGRIFRNFDFGLICKKAQEMGTDRVIIIHARDATMHNLGVSIYCYLYITIQ